MTDDIDEIVRLREISSRKDDEIAKLLREIERLKAERDVFDEQATGLFHKCAELMRRAEAAENTIRILMDQCQRKRDALNEVLNWYGNDRLIAFPGHQIVKALND